MNTVPHGILIHATGRLEEKPNLLRFTDGRAFCAFKVVVEPAMPGYRPLTKRVVVIGNHTPEGEDNAAYKAFLFLDKDSEVTVFGVERDRDWHLRGCSLRRPRIEASALQIHQPRTQVLFAGVGTGEVLIP